MEGGASRSVREDEAVFGGADGENEMSSVGSIMTEGAIVAVCLCWYIEEHAMLRKIFILDIKSGDNRRLLNNNNCRDQRKSRNAGTAG